MPTVPIITGWSGDIDDMEQLNTNLRGMNDYNNKKKKKYGGIADGGLKNDKYHGGFDYNNRWGCEFCRDDFDDDNLTEMDNKFVAVGSPAVHAEYEKMWCELLKNGPYEYWSQVQGCKIKNKVCKMEKQDAEQM